LPDRPTHINIALPEQQASVTMVKAVAGENLGMPVWSPDGRRVIYKKAFPAGPGAIWSVSTEGQDNRKLKDISRADLSSGLSVSPDGNTILYSDSTLEKVQFSVRSLNLRTMKEQTLTSPPASYWGDWDPKFSPDGGTIAFKRVKDSWQDYIYTLPASGGPARQVTHQEQISIYGHAWMPGGNLLLSCQLGGIVHGLWRVPVNHPGKPQPLFLAGVDAVTPAVSPDGTRIAWANRVNDRNIYSIPLRGGKPSRIIATTVYESNPAFAPDGRLAYVSYRSGSAEIWIGAADGSNAVRVTNLKKGSISHPVWSPDGKRLVFDSPIYGNYGIVSIECPPKTTECSSPSPVSQKADAEVLPGWSADGNFIYFTAADGNRIHQIWKRPIAGGKAIQITHSGAFGSEESRDGKWVYYTKPTPTLETPTIWRSPVTGGTETDSKAELLIGPPFRPTAQWTVAGDEVIFFDRGNGSTAPAFLAYHTVTAQVRTIVEVNEGHCPVISPDGRTLVYSALDRSGSNVVVARLSR
jgi:Tol biopolymer transport system component